MKIDTEALLKKAEKASENSYCRYSGFAVGAALLCADGSVYTGCNIENASFTPTVCAERTAFFKAISEGKYDLSRKDVFIAIAIVGKNFRNPENRFLTPPCGVCRQVMAEFCSEDFQIIMHQIENGKEKTVISTLSEILPFGFSDKNFK